MKHIKYYITFLSIILLGTMPVKKQLDVQNPNNPSLVDAQTESGIISLSQGAVYLNGFNLAFNTGLNQLGSGFYLHSISDTRSC
ncbi:MAG: hypothetical protein WKF59_11090 [Chitinophagaceae bacterium]